MFSSVAELVALTGLLCVPAGTLHNDYPFTHARATCYRSQGPSVLVYFWDPVELWRVRGLWELYLPIHSSVQLLTRMYLLVLASWLLILLLSKRSLCAVGEMSTWAPISGTFPHFGARLVYSISLATTLTGLDLSCSLGGSCPRVCNGMGT